MLVVEVGGIATQDDLVVACACWVWWWTAFEKLHFLFKLLFPTLGYNVVWGEGARIGGAALYLWEKSKIHLAMIEISINICLLQCMANSLTNKQVLIKSLQTVGLCLTVSISSAWQRCCRAIRTSQDVLPRGLMFTLFFFKKVKGLYSRSTYNTG